MWNNKTQLYQVDDALHQKLLDSDPKFTFQLGDNLKDGSIVEINLPYAAFDLTAKYPFVVNETRYFPLQPAKNESQYILGRTFLQEA